MSVRSKKYRLRSSIAITESSQGIDFFKTNIRETVSIKIDYPEIVNLLKAFDGNTEVGSICERFKIESPDEIEALIAFLNNEKLIIEIDESYEGLFFSENYRLINLLEDFCRSSSDVMRSIEKISNFKVAVIGLGAVGTWICTSLAMTGVKNFILIDGDTVDLSNLHRQDCFFEEDVGKSKVQCATRRLEEISDVNVIQINDFLDGDFFNRHPLDCDLIINCADYPSVDETSRIVGKYGIDNAIPHIIGGGYNLHLTLIGQAVIPRKTACVMCFEHAMKKINSAELCGVEKLHRPLRKIGSFGPLCMISASISASEAIKIAAGKTDYLVTANQRIEFRIEDMDFFSSAVERDLDCVWCG